MQHSLLGIIPIIIASFAYPLGNRKMMEVCAGRLDSYQRVLGMTLAIMGEILLLSAKLPSLISWIGMFLIVLGLILQSYVSQIGFSKQNRKAAKNT